MSSQEAADSLRVLAPFARALAELGEKIDTLSGLDATITTRRQDLERVKAAHVEATNAVTAATQDAQTSRDNLQRELAAARQAHDNDLQQQRAAFEAEQSKQVAEFAQQKTDNEHAGQRLLFEARKEAAEIVAKAKADAEAVRAEHADLESRLPALRAEHDKARSLLADINARIDAHRAA